MVEWAATPERPRKCSYGRCVDRCRSELQRRRMKMQCGSRVTNGSEGSDSSVNRGAGYSRTWPARGAWVRVSRPERKWIQATAGLACSRYTCLMRGRSAAGCRGPGTRSRRWGCRVGCWMLDGNAGQASRSAGRQAGSDLSSDSVHSGRHEGNRRRGQVRGQSRRASRLLRMRWRA